MSAIGLARRCYRRCGKERGPGRRRRRRQQPCLSSCSSCCCCPDSASPTASVSPPAAFRPLGLQLWTKQACNQKGELRGAPASPTCLRPEHGHCKGSGASWGAGCSAIVTAAPERARKDGGGNLFVQRPGAPLEPYSPLLLGDPAAGLLAGEGKDNPV